MIAVWLWPGLSAAAEAAWGAYIRDGTSAAQRGDYAIATKQFQLALKEAELFGTQDPRLVRSLNSLAELYETQGRHVDAEALYKRSLAIFETVLTPDHPGVALGLSNLATVYVAQGRYAMAEPLHKRSLAIREKALGPEHPDVATSLNNLAELYLVQGRYADAVPLLIRSLAIRERALGPQHLDVASSINNLAVLYQAQGRYPEAESLKKRSLEIFEKVLGPDHPRVAISLNNLAVFYQSQGRYADAEPIFKRSLAIREKALGREHPDVGLALNNLAALYQTQGRSIDAEPLFKRSLAISEKALGAEHPAVALGLSNLAGFYKTQERYLEADPLYMRALVIYEKALGPDHPDVARCLNNFALIKFLQGNYTVAELLYRRSLAIREKALGLEHSDVAITLNNLAGLYEAQGRYADAEPLFKRSLAIKEKALGADHPDVATSLNNLAATYMSQARYATAEPIFKRSLAITEKALGPEHPDVANSFSNLAFLYSAQGRNQDALDIIRKATRIGKTRSFLDSVPRSASNLSEQRSYSGWYSQHVEILGAALTDTPKQRDILSKESFEVSQLARASDTGGVIARMTARFAKGNDELAQFTRMRQDMILRWQFVDTELVKAVSKLSADRNIASEKAMRDELVRLDKQLTELDAVLEKRFPEYKSLTNPEPLKIADAQALLGQREALVTYLVRGQKSYLWVLRRDRAQFLRLDIGRAELDKSVQLLRRQLDPSAGFLRPFSLTQAHELYRRIFQPAEALLKGATHVMVIADGALQSLPFGVLVSELPKAAQSADYRNASWLAKRYAFSSLPSESSLRALRKLAKSAAGNQPFSGFGDPVLDGGSQSRGIKIATLFARGPIADVRAVKQLQRLPETADELNAIAKSLGADKQTVHLQLAATETNVKKADLTRIRVLAFATHGLMAGDFKGLAEPALVLTPPKVGTELDDGLLTASEVAQLKLNADWVILSACNTAAADGTPGAEGLSGLAKAFFYAGSRALLVSHWPVVSAATVKLTTRMFKESTDNLGIGRAEALRRSMLALMTDEKAPEFAHPAMWAPFVVVGEGASLQRK